MVNPLEYLGGNKMRATIKFTVYFEAEVSEEDMLMDVYEKSKATNFQQTKDAIIAEFNRNEEFSKIEIKAFEVIENE